MKRSNTISDLSAVVTGLILALNLPPTVPLWMVVVGAVVAIVVIKQLFGEWDKISSIRHWSKSVFIYILCKSHDQLGNTGY